MILEAGSKVLLAHRRLFESDSVRFFVGVVDDYEAGMARITGHTWLRDGYRGIFTKKSDGRTKVISLSSGTIIVYQLPSTVQMSSLRFDISEGTLLLEDGEGFRMDLSEGTHGARNA